MRITGTVSEVRAADARTSLVLLKAETVQLGHEVVPLGETVRVYQAAARKNARSAAGSGKVTPTPGDASNGNWNGRKQGSCRLP